MAAVDKAVTQLIGRLLVAEKPGQDNVGPHAPKAATSQERA